MHIYGLLQLGTITNVETVLTGLASTYATISSLSAYVKSSVANTFSALQTFSNGIGIPSTYTQPSTANQIGHTLTYYSGAVATVAFTNLAIVSLGSMTLPAGVWMLTTTYYLWESSLIPYQFMGLGTGTTNGNFTYYTSSANMTTFTTSTNTSPQVGGDFAHTYQQVQTGITNNGITIPVTKIYVQKTSGTIYFNVQMYFGSSYTGTYNYTSNVYTLATRIA